MKAGNNLIREWIQFIQQYNLYQHVVFLSDYDVLLTEHLVQGADVWVNTPRRPWEASGTSGMKVLVNGGINLSELDGWWAEAYTAEVGWSLGDGQEHGDDPAWDAREAEALYDILEKQVVPEFYNRNEKGIPEKWVGRMRKSMSLLTPQFSANRTVREYTEKYYLPRADNYKKRAAEKAIEGNKIVNLHHHLRNTWQEIQFGEIQTANIENGYRFQVQVKLNNVNPDNVLVELYAEGINGAAPEIITMTNGSTSSDNGLKKYDAKVNSLRPASDYTIRIIPHYENISVPLEDNLILWQH